MDLLHQSLFLLSISTSFSYGWHETSLPWTPSVRPQVKEETFYKFWKRVVLKTIIPTDYDAWFKRFRRNKPPYEMLIGSNFSCPVTSSITPSRSVHTLTPADIKVVAAIGDSVTAGFGAGSKNLADLFVEYRDTVWSIGGYGSLEEATTLPNILKKYNPDVFGSSNQITAVADFKEKESGFNFAKSGATAEGAKERVEELISEMKESKQINFKMDWKLLTIFIGTNDLCMSCFDRDFAPRNFLKKVSKTLEKIQEKMPKVLVNLVQIFDATRFNELKGPYCKAFHRKICPCASGGPARKAMVSRTAKEYARMLSGLVKSPRFQNNPDFAVVLQPFLLNSQLPKLSNGKVDRSYLAPDCFHWSTKGQALLATSLWNNMLQPVGEKTTSWISNEGLNCPRPDFPYFFTNLNSKQYSAGKSYEFYNGKGGPGIHKSIRENEKERKEKGELEKEKETKTVALLVTAGVVMVAVAAGIVIHISKRRNRNLGHAQIAPCHNYNTMKQETLM